MIAASEIDVSTADRRLLDYQALADACEAASLMRAADGRRASESHYLLEQVAKAQVRLARMQIRDRAALEAGTHATMMKSYAESPEGRDQHIRNIAREEAELAVRGSDQNRTAKHRWFSLFRRGV